MASLRLTFPEKDEPTVIALTGARLTIGRLPFNTIQIIDRTVSGFHAELISEHGHYRLHDRGSSNGTFVNGQKVADFHLSEPCTITFGTVEAQFSPEAVAVNEEAENFPTRSEINAVRKENVELKATVEALREETHALRMARPMEGGDAAMAVPKEEFEKVVIEREGLKEDRLKQDEEITRLKTDLAVLKRDRVNLQLAYDGLQRDITDLRAKAGGVEAIALPPKAAAAALAAQAPSPGEEVRVEVPVPAKTVRPVTPVSPAPVETPAEEKEAEPAVAEKAAEPPADAPKPAAVPVYFTKAPPTSPTPAKMPSGPMKPFAPLAKKPVTAEGSGETAAPEQPAAPAKQEPAAPAKQEAAPNYFTRVPPATPAPAKTPAAPSKPFAPLPKAPAVAATVIAKPVGSTLSTPAAPEKAGAPKAPVGLGTGIRPMSKPAVPEPNGVEDITAAQTARLSPMPPPPGKLPPPTVKLPAAPAPKVGPKGTQKLS